MNLEEVKALISEHNLTADIVTWATNETEKGKELLTNYAKNEVNNRTREIYDAFDKDLSELGIEKNGRKTYEAYKDAVLSNREKVDELKKKLEELKDKNPDEVLTSQIEALRNDLESKNKDYEQLKSETVNYKKNSWLDSAFNSLAIDDKYKTDSKEAKLFEAYKTNELNKLRQSTDLDGEDFVIKREGEIWLNQEHKPIHAKDALTEIFKDFIKTKGGKGIDSKNGSQGVKTLSVNIDMSKLNGLEGNSRNSQAVSMLREAYHQKGLDWTGEQFNKDYKILTNKD